MSNINKVIFVCVGNTCRSPMAATIMSTFLQGTDILVQSRGMVVLFPEPYNPKAVAVASKHGMIMVSDSTKQIENEDFDNNTLVLVMNSNMKKKLYDKYDRAINVYTLSEYAGEGDIEVLDPYGKGMEEYNKCFEQLYILLERAARNIIGQDS